MSLCSTVGQALADRLGSAFFDGDDFHGDSNKGALAPQRLLAIQRCSLQPRALRNREHAVCCRIERAVTELHLHLQRRCGPGSR